MIALAAIQRRVGARPDGKWGPLTAAAITAALDSCGYKQPAGRALRNPEAFYVAVRGVTKSLNTVQFNTVQALLTSASHWSTAWLAYGLATAWHEARFEPIEEIGKGRGKRYGVPGPHGGQIPFGRGLVQLTWPDNYEWADKECGLEGALIADYAQALRPNIAVMILVRGMEQGAFAKDREGRRHSLARHLPDERGTPGQFEAARRIINGTDQATLVAGYAERFQDALTAGGWA